MEYTDFPTPSASTVAIGALRVLARYGTHVVVHGSDGSMSLAISEREALDLANPNGGDMFFPIRQFIEDLSQGSSQV